MKTELQKLLIEAENLQEQNKKFFANLRKKKPKNLDYIVQELHLEAFDKINCLECANCCKSLGPRITDKDIEKLSKALKMKSAAFIETYLRIDEDRDFVFKTMPCPFLMNDNYCMVYENRPKACREYPHTDSRQFYKLLNLTLQNTKTCPAVVLIVEELKKKI